MYSRLHADCNFINYDQLTYLGNSAFTPSDSINISKNSKTLNMLDEDDIDGSDLISMINRSLQDFNESMIEDGINEFHDDSAYNTAASSLSNQDTLKNLFAEMSLSAGQVLNNNAKRNFQAMRNMSGDHCASGLPKISSITSPGLANSRRRLQSCSVIGSNPLESEFELINQTSPNSKVDRYGYGFSSPVGSRQCRTSTGPSMSEFNDTSRCLSALSTNTPGPNMFKGNRACSFFLRGHCKKEDCEFAHDLSKVTCRFWKTDSCIKGASCPFLHGYPEELDSGPLSSSLPCRNNELGWLK